MRRLFSWLILFGICLPSITNAVGLGELQVNSALNQPLAANIELVQVPASDINDIEVRIAPSEVFDEIGIERPILLTNLIFDAVVENGQSVIKITSPSPVVEPFLNFVIEVTWPGGRFLREYTALLDPPTYDNGSSTRIAAPSSGVTDLEYVSDYDSYASAESSYNSYSSSTDGEFVPYSQIDNVDSNTSYDTAGTYTESYDGDSSTYETSTYASEGSYTTGTTGDAYLDSLPIAQTFPLEGGETISTGGNYDDYSSDSYTEDATSYESYSETSTYTESEYSVDDSAGVTYQSSYESDYSSTDDGYYNVGFGEYKVERGDMLWNIAQAHRGDSVSVSQMMIAMLRENPEAFIDNNINRLKSGYVLRIPELDTAASIARSEALAEVQDQHNLWRQYSGVLSNVAVAQQAVGNNQAVARGNTGTSTPTVANNPDLEIVVPKAGQGTAGTVLADAGRVSDLENEVQLAQEQLRTADREKSELQSRVAELEGLLQSKDRMIQLKDEKLNELQRTVGEAEMELKEAQSVVQEAKPEPTPVIEPVPQPEPVAQAEIPVVEPVVPVQEKPEPKPEPKPQPRLEPKPEPLVEPEPKTEPAKAVEPVAKEEIQTARSSNKAPWYLNKALLGGGAGLIAILTGLLAFFTKRKRDQEFERAAQELQDYEAGLAPTDTEFADDVKPPTGMLDMNDKYADLTEGGLEEVEISNEDMLADAEQVLIDVNDGEPLPDIGGEEDLTQETALTEENEISIDQQEDLKSADTGFVPKVDADLTTGAPLDEDFTAELDATPFKEPTGDMNDDEVTSELDIYLAYGLHDQVIEQAKQHLEKEPENQDYHQRLFKAYLEKGDKDTFATEAAMVKERFGDTSPLWKEVAILGYSLDASNPLYAEGSDSSIIAEDLMPSKPDNLDIQITDDQVDAENLDASADAATESFQETQVIEPFGVSPEQHEALVGREVDSIEDELVETVILEDSSLDELRAAADGGDDNEFSLDIDSPMEAVENETSEETSEFEYELSSIKGMESSSSATPADITEILPEEEVPELGEADDDEFNLDFDMPEMAAAGGAVAAVGAAGAALSDSVPDLSQTIKITDDDKDELMDLPELSLDDLDDSIGGDDEMATKLDLAKAYVDMGDDEGARDALNEVINAGDEQQKVEAERLLNQLR